MGLNTTNPEYLVWEYKGINIAILGGLKIEGLARKREFLKVAWKEQVIRHNLDLYYDAGVEKLVRRCAERFSLGTSFIGEIITVLVNLLEEYRLAELAKGVKQEQRQPMSKEREKEVEQFLKQDNLLARINELIGKSGVVGEEVNRLLMYFIFTSRKREQPLHVISLESSGTGKSHLQEKVGELMPDEEKIEITTLSENAFHYFGKQELKHKLILIEDLD